MQKAQLDDIRDRRGLAACIRDLRDEFNTDPNRWENNDLSSFLEALAAWVNDMDGYFANQNQSAPDRPEWKTFAEMLVAATMYE